MEGKSGFTVLSRKGELVLVYDPGSRAHLLWREGTPPENALRLHPVGEILVLQAVSEGYAPGMTPEAFARLLERAKGCGPPRLDADFDVG